MLFLFWVFNYFLHSSKHLQCIFPCLFENFKTYSCFLPKKCFYVLQSLNLTFFWHTTIPVRWYCKYLDYYNALTICFSVSLFKFSIVRDFKPWTSQLISPFNFPFFLLGNDTTHACKWTTKNLSAISLCIIKQKRTWSLLNG